MKKKIIIAISSIIGLLLAIVIFFVCFYNFLLSPIDKKNNDNITFTINGGTSIREVIKELKKENFIRSELPVYAYVKLKNINGIQAGTYTIRKNMNVNEIMNKFVNGEANIETTTIQFIEGKRITRYAKDIASKFNYTEEEVLNVLSDKKFLESCIDKYWFIDKSILNKELYYPLEGYLFADTYTFYDNASIEEIIYTMLDTMGKKLSIYEDEIKNSGYSVHEILAMASIVELEGNTSDDRNTISQVIYKRLASNMSLGMDVTTYYAVKKEMGSVLTIQDLKTINPYNTRDNSGAMNGKLPVGPICTPSLMSINAVFNPSNTNYLYFYADVSTGDVYFANTEQEFLDIVSKFQ